MHAVAHFYAPLTPQRFTDLQRFKRTRNPFRCAPSAIWNRAKPPERRTYDEVGFDLPTFRMLLQKLAHDVARLLQNHSIRKADISLNAKFVEEDVGIGSGRFELNPE
jgi:hypothetical protein